MGEVTEAWLQVGSLDPRQKPLGLLQLGPQGVLFPDLDVFATNREDKSGNPTVSRLGTERTYAAF